jgi:plasmid stability protein
MPAELKARLEQAAKGNHRSVTAELVARLETSFSSDVASFLPPGLRGRVEERAKLHNRSVADEIYVLLLAYFLSFEDGYDPNEPEDFHDFEPVDPEDPILKAALEEMALAALYEKVERTESRLATVESQLQQVLELLQKK